MGRPEAVETNDQKVSSTSMLAELVSRAGREGVRVGWNSALDAVAKGVEKMRPTVINRSCEGTLDALALAIADMRMQSESMESPEVE